MTEEQAIELWRELAPIEAAIKRTQPHGAHDRAVYTVAVLAPPLTGRQLHQILGLVDRMRLDTLLTVQGNEPVLVIRSLEAAPVHPATPR